MEKLYGMRLHKYGEVVEDAGKLISGMLEGFLKLTGYYCSGQSMRYGLESNGLRSAMRKRGRGLYQ
jgi:hypothetical protein